MRRNLALSAAWMLITAVAPTAPGQAEPPIAAGLGRVTRQIVTNLVPASVPLMGINYLNGEIFVTGRVGTTPTVFVISATTGLPVRAFTAPEYLYDGATDGQSLLFRTAGGVRVMDAYGNAVSQVLAANGLQTIGTQPIPVGPMSGPFISCQGLEFLPSGNGGSGSLLVRTYPPNPTLPATVTRECTLSGTPITESPPASFFDSGLAQVHAGRIWTHEDSAMYEWLAPSLGSMASLPNLTINPSGVSAASSARGLAQVPGGLDGRGTGADLVYVLEPSFNTTAIIVAFRVDSWSGPFHTNESELRVGKNGGPLTRSYMGIGPSVQTLDFGLVSYSAVPPPLSTWWLWINVEAPPTYPFVLRPVGPVAGYGELLEFRLQAWFTQFLSNTDLGIGPLSGYAPVSLPVDLSVLGGTYTFHAQALFGVTGVPGGLLPLTASNLSGWDYSASPSASITVTASGADSYNATTTPFWTVQTTSADPITEVEFSWTGSSNPAHASTVFDLIQPLPAGSGGGVFLNGNAPPATCPGTYRNGTHTTTGLNFNHPLINGWGSCGTIPAQNMGARAVWGTTGFPAAKTLHWWFSGGSFTGTSGTPRSLQMDIDVDGNTGGTGASALAGMVVRVWTAGGFFGSAELQMVSSTLSQASFAP